MENECAHCMPDGYMKGADTRQDAEATPQDGYEEVLMEYVRGTVHGHYWKCVEVKQRSSVRPREPDVQSESWLFLFDGLAS